MTKAIMHDFGVLGKWSHDTLKANLKTDWRQMLSARTHYLCNPKVSAIEMLYTTTLDLLEARQRTQQNKRIIFMTVSDLAHTTKSLRITNAALMKLNKDYKNYQTTIGTILDIMNKDLEAEHVSKKSSR